MSSTLKLRKCSAARFLETEAFAALGKDWFAEFPARRVPGKVVWCNFELARQLGFDVPRSDQLTREFEDELIAKLSLRALTPGEEVRADEIDRKSTRLNSSHIPL